MESGIPLLAQHPLLWLMYSCSGRCPWEVLTGAAQPRLMIFKILAATHLLMTFTSEFFYRKKKYKIYLIVSEEIIKRYEAENIIIAKLSIT